MRASISLSNASDVAMYMACPGNDNVRSSARRLFPERAPPVMRTTVIFQTFDSFDYQHCPIGGVRRWQTKFYR
jgi:hypothetical protein